MNNDVIELAKEIKRRSELVLQAEREDNGEFYKHWNKLDLMMSPQNLIKLCDAVEKLAEYENMEPVAWARNTGMDRRLDLTTLPERVIEWQEIKKSHRDWTDDIFPLYRHPSK
ncbi:hypothetical protein [Xenorhabdus littoralis]|uniref:hypothetical protein n=1 Tax=Xenorhabdus littoralis TaxID=2582835 RepID=UPI0029E7E5A0|nr:hypothetical protein [Xenorhabdus sp. psl]MDX7992628.1 hypothetical protein [Xenorhabdus sp. psl]